MEREGAKGSYTDGATEACNDAGEEYGEHRLIEALRRYRERPSSALLTSIADDIQQFSPNQQRDDITLVVSKCGRFWGRIVGDAEVDAEVTI